MKRHPFLEVDFHSTVKLKASEVRQIKGCLALGSRVFEKLVRSKIIPRPASSYQVSLLICGDDRMKKLNKEYRGKNKTTDVLSFPAQENLRKYSSGANQLHLGDLAISLPQAKRQAREFDIGIWDEFIHLFFHGLIHLLGFDHEISGKEEKLMQKWEEKALSEFSRIKKGSA